MQVAILDHDQTVVELLQCLTQHQFKLNPEKIKSKFFKALFIGHILTQEDLKPNTEIAKAVIEIPRRFLDTVTRLSKFDANLSEVVRPLLELTHVKHDIVWADQRS